MLSQDFRAPFEEKGGASSNMASRVTFVTGTAEVKRRENGLAGLDKPTVTMIDGKCDCCPYGYHIDLDFINFCESINSGSTLKKLKRIQRAKRKLRKSMEVMLQQQDQARMEDAGTPPPDVVHLTEANRLMNMVEYEQSSTHRILDDIDSSVDQTIAHIDYMMRPTRKQMRYFSSDSEDGVSPVSPSRYNTFPLRRSPNGDESSHFATSLSTSGRTDSMSSLSSVSTVSSENPQGQVMMTHGGHGTQYVHTTATAEIAHSSHRSHHHQQTQKYHTVTSAQLAETMAAHFPQTEREGSTSSLSSTTNISQMSLSAIREAMAMSLQRMKDLEEQVKALPIMQVRISVLKEEKRLLMLQLRAKNAKLNTRSIGVGDKSINAVDVSETSSMNTKMVQQSTLQSFKFSEQFSPHVLSPIKSPPPTLPKPKKSRTVAVGDHSVIEPYLLQPNLSTGYTIKENEVHTEIRSTTYESFFREMPRLETKFDPTARSPIPSPVQQSTPRPHITINQIQRGSPKAMTRSIGVGEGNVFDTSGLHIHEKELRTVIIGQGTATTKRNVGIECKVSTRDVGVSYVCDDEKPATRTVGVNVDTGSLLTSLSFKGEELRGALRDMLSKSVRSIGTNCNFRPLTIDIGTVCDQIGTVCVGVGDCRTDVDVRDRHVMKSIGIVAHPETMNRYVGTDKGWVFDMGTNTPILDKRNKSTATDKPKYVYGSTNTDVTTLRNSANQTEVRMFHSLDQLKNVGSNTRKVSTRNTAVNTEHKCLQSDTYDFAITFQEQAANTEFSVADRGMNTERSAAAYTKKGRTKNVGVSHDTVDSVLDLTDTEEKRSSTETVITTVRSTVDGGKSYIPSDMSRFMTVEGSSSIRSKGSSESNARSSDMSSSSTSNASRCAISSTSLADVKRHSSEGSQRHSPTKGSPTKGGSDLEEYRYSEETYVIRGNDLEHGDFEIVQELGGTEKRLLTSKSDIPIAKVMGVEDRQKRLHRRVDDTEGVGYIRYVTGGQSESGASSSSSSEQQMQTSSSSEGYSSMTSSMERGSRRTSPGSPEEFPSHSLDRHGMHLDGLSHGGGQTVVTVEETVMGSGDLSPTRHFERSDLSPSLSPRLAKRGAWERSQGMGGIEEIAGFSLSTSPTRLSGGSFTSESGGSDTQLSDGGTQSLTTRTVTRSSRGGGTVTVEESSSSRDGHVTSTRTVTGNPELLDSGSQSQQVSQLKSELNNLAGNLNFSKVGFSSSGSSLGEYKQDLGADLDLHQASSPHSSVNTSFDSESGTLRSIMKKSKLDAQVKTGVKADVQVKKTMSIDAQVKKGISFASNVVGGTDTDHSEESENEEGNDSDSSYEEGSYDGRQGSIVYQCRDDEAIAKGLPGAQMFDQNIRETFELSKDVRKACDVLANYLVDSTSIRTSQLNTNLSVIQKEWFQASSQKLSDPYQVEDYMSSFNEISKKLLEYIVNMSDSNGNTAIHYAVSNCNCEVIGLFLDSGVVDVNKQNKAGYTPIMLGSLAYVQTQTQINTLRRLFMQGDVNLKSSQAGQTALMLAVSHGRTNMVELLLQCGAAVNARDDDGSTAIMCACEHGHSEIVKILLAHPGTDASLTDNDGSTALSIAMEADHKDIGVVIYAHLNFSKTLPGLARKRKSSSSPTPSLVSR